MFSLSLFDYGIFIAMVNLSRDVLPHLYNFGFLQIVGSRGPIEINPRLTMGKDSDIRGMALFASDLVSLGNCTRDLQNIWIKCIRTKLQNVRMSKAGQCYHI